MRCRSKRPASGRSRDAYTGEVICPQCNAEYRDGFTRCSDCDVDLVEPPPPPPPDERGQIELVKIYEGGNPAFLPVLESLLADAEIEFSTTSENLQDLFGRLGSAYNYAIGPVMLYVRREDEAEALAIVAGLREDAPALPD
jgi:hypothetical protein